jgi:hypothetical protein
MRRPAHGLAEPGVAHIGLTFLDAPVQGIAPATLAVNGDEGDPDWAGERLKQVGYACSKRRRLARSFSMACSMVFAGLACRVWT